MVMMGQIGDEWSSGCEKWTLASGTLDGNPDGDCQTDLSALRSSVDRSSTVVIIIFAIIISGFWL